MLRALVTARFVGGIDPAPPTRKTPVRSSQNGPHCSATVPLYYKRISPRTRQSEAETRQPITESFLLVITNHYLGLRKRRRFGLETG